MKLSEVMKPFDILQVVPKFSFSRFLHPKEYPSMITQGLIIRDQHIVFKNCNCHKDSTHILTATSNINTFEWTEPRAKRDKIDKLKDKHVRVFRYVGYQWTKKDEEAMKEFFEKVLADPELSDYKELTYLGHLLKLAIGDDAFKIIPGKGKVCSSGAGATNIYVHKKTGAPRFFRNPNPWDDNGLNYAPDESLTPAHWGCWRPMEFKKIYDESKCNP